MKVLNLFSWNKSHFEWPWTPGDPNLTILHIWDGLGGGRLQIKIVEKIPEEKKLLQLGQGLAKAFTLANPVLAHGRVGFVLACV